MRSIQLRNSRKLSENSKPYIVAEVNTSHSGNMAIAKQMIAKAKEIGCDCVKFQSWSAETLFSKTFYKENPIANRIFKKFSFAEDALAEAAAYCQEIGIGFSSTPYSKAEVDFLAKKTNAPFIKVASMDLNNYQYLDYIARTGVPMVLSTGMSDMTEIRRAVKTIEAAGNTNICILHCVSIYPPRTSSLSLKNITGLRNEFPNYPIGYSDHSLGTEMSAASIALGAVLVEKHFTLDQKKIGMDNQMASEPEEMAQLVKFCHNVHEALGTVERVVPDEELEQRKKMRRSLIAAKDLKKGTVLKLEDLDAKRPGTGFPPEMMESLVGKTLSRDIEQDTLFSEEDFA